MVVAVGGQVANTRSHTLAGTSDWTADAPSSSGHSAPAVRAGPSTYGPPFTNSRLSAPVPAGSPALPGSNGAIFATPIAQLILLDLHRAAPCRHGTYKSAIRPLRKS